MELAVLTILGVVALLGFSAMLRRATELARIRIVLGRVQFVRGRLPVRLRREIEDILERSASDEGQIWLRLEGQQARVHAKGLPTETVQQLRNVLGQFSVAQLRRAPKL